MGGQHRLNESGGAVPIRGLSCLYAASRLSSEYAAGKKSPDIVIGREGTIPKIRWIAGPPADVANRSLRGRAGATNLEQCSKRDLAGDPAAR